MIELINNKIKIILVIVLLSVTFVFFRNFNGICFEVYINHKVSLWNPTNIETIYRYNFREGEDFYIFSYDNDKDIKKIIQKNKFKMINQSNLNSNIRILNMYRADLCEKELELFDKTTNISELSKIGNYYLYKEDIEDDEDYFICIISPIDKKVFYFNINH